VEEEEEGGKPINPISSFASFPRALSLSPSLSFFSPVVSIHTPHYTPRKPIYTHALTPLLDFRYFRFYNSVLLPSYRCVSIFDTFRMTSLESRP